MTTTGEARELLFRSALLQGEADALSDRALRAARRGDVLRAWELEQLAGRAQAQAKAYALQANELQRVAEQAAAQACAICAAALGRGR